MIANCLAFNNHFQIEHWREDRLLKRFLAKNDVTIEGKNHVLDVVFGAAAPVTQIDPWYIGLIDNASSPVLAEADTLASHSGWTEFTSYSGNRKEWDDADASSKIKASSAVAEFTASGSGTIYGIFLASAATGTSGTLFATAAFDVLATVVSSDVLRVTYSVRL